MKNILLSLVFFLLVGYAQAQNGLEGIIVEKYYVSTAADAAGSSGALPVGSVTYRIYADMLPGYRFQTCYGDPNHSLILSTTTSFFNNEEFGSTSPNAISFANAKKNTVMLDSWVTSGAACGGRYGVMKSEDDVTLGGANAINVNGLLANTDAAMGIPLTTQDGFWTGTPLYSTTTIGIDLALLDASNVAGPNVITTESGAWAALEGQASPITTTNRVLLGQFTTDGVFHYEFNIQIGTPSRGVENYVKSNPIPGEIVLASLTGTYGALNALPTVAITAPVTPASSVTGAVVNIIATATDADGTITKVEFFNGATKVGEDLTSPYEYAYTGVVGVHSFTAKATDDQGGVKTSAAMVLTVSNDPMPLVSITAPIAGSSSKVGVPVTITATATDNGTVSQVEFFDGATSLGVDNSSPYSVTYTPTTVGNHSLTAKATDNINQVATSATVSTTVLANVAPMVTITAPTGGNLIMNVPIVITATATDGDGTVASVVIKVNGTPASPVVFTAPSTYTYAWTPSAAGTSVIDVIATDNDGTATTKTVSVNVIDPAGVAPYEIGLTADANVIREKCFVNTISIPVYSTKTAMVGVIGYDVALKYDAAKVVPTTNITVSNALLGTDPATITRAAVNIDAAHSLVNITIYFNGTALETSNFRGEGLLFSLDFTKKSAFGPVDEAVFSMPIFVESYRTETKNPVTKGGKFITYQDTEFNGSLKYWKGNMAIQYDTLHPLDYLITNISGDVKPLVNVQPDLFGNFKYNTANGQTIEIKRDILNTTSDVHSVIMSADALAAAYIANKNATVFTPNVFNMIAADVNLDGVVSAGDASQINLRAVNQIHEFSQSLTVLNGATSKDWLFVNSATLTLDRYKISGSYPEDDLWGFSKNKVPHNLDGSNHGIFTQALPWADWTGCPEIVGDTYTGIMLGDVNGDYVAIPKDGLLKSATLSNDLVTLDFSKAKQEGNVVTVPVSVSSTIPELHAIDLGIFINDDNIENIEIAQGKNFSIFNLGYNAETKKLDIAGFNSENSISKSNSFSLVITKKGPEALTASDFDAVQVDLTNNPMGEIVKGRLNVVGLVTGIAKPGVDNAESVLVYPNPANDHLNVKVSEDSNVQIFDMSSKLLIQTTVKVGVNDIRGIQNLANGIYMMKISNGNSTSMHKVIIKK